MQHTSYVQQVCTVKTMKQSELDQVEPSVSHIHLSLTHEQTKGTHHISSSIIYTQKERILQAVK